MAENRFPPQIRYIVGNEACERFSFYGMRSILTVFLVAHLGMAAPEATSVFHLFVSAAYLSPLLGGWLADRFLGKYRTILYISLFYCAGHGVMALWDSKAGVYWGLFLIALGAGGIKPCVSAFVGDQFTEENKHLVRKVYDLFYWSINLGSVASTLIIPWVLPRYGASWAFGIPGILMAIATLIFWAGRRSYVMVPPTGRTDGPGFLRIVLHAAADSWDSARARYGAEEVDAARAAASIFKVFATVSIFWALFDQHGSTWVLQARRMDLEVLGVRLEASQIAALNPLMVLTLIPVFAFAVYPAVERLGIEVTPLRRMGAGMAVTALSFVFAGVYESILDSGRVLSVAWQFIPYLLITAAEVMVSITGLEFAYTQAPRSMKSTIMSFWLLTIFAGNLLTSVVARLNVFRGAVFFHFFAALMAAVTVLFAVTAARYRVRDYMEKPG